MGDRLQLDLASVRDTAGRLGYIRSNLEDAESNADELSGMIPHGGLAGAVRKFGKNWDVARTELTDKLEGLQKATEGVADTLTEVDSELASAVEGD